MSRAGKSGVEGVVVKGDAYIVRFKVCGKLKQYGRYECIEKAIARRDEVKAMLTGVPKHLHAPYPKWKAKFKKIELEKQKPSVNIIGEGHAIYCPNKFFSSYHTEQQAEEAANNRSNVWVGLLSELAF